MNRIAEMTTRLASMPLEDQTRVLTNLVHWFRCLAENRPHHPAVSEFAQAFERSSARTEYAQHWSTLAAKAACEDRAITDYHAQLVAGQLYEFVLPVRLKEGA